MKALMTEQGLLIPKDAFSGWGDVVIEEKPYHLVIRPRSMTQLTYGALQADPDRLQELLDAVEAGEAAMGHGESAT